MLARRLAVATMWCSGTVLFGRMHGGAAPIGRSGKSSSTRCLARCGGRHGRRREAVRARSSAGVSPSCCAHAHASLARARRCMLAVAAPRARLAALAQRCSGVAAPAPLFSALLNYRHSRRNRSDDERGGKGSIALRRGAHELSAHFVGRRSGRRLRADGADADARSRRSGYAPICASRWRASSRRWSRRRRRRCATIDILPRDERHRLLVEWNDTAADYPKDRLLHELFEEQAARAPDAVGAGLRRGAALLWRAERAGQSSGASPARAGGRAGAIVGLCVERSFEMIVGLSGRSEGGRGLSADRSGLSARSHSVHARGRRAVARAHAGAFARAAAGDGRDAASRRGLGDDRAGERGEPRADRDAAEPRLCHLHIRLDRKAERRRRHASERASTSC